MSKEKLNPDGSVDVNVNLNKKTKEYILQYVLKKDFINPKHLYYQKNSSKGNLTSALIAYGCIELMKEYILECNTTNELK